MARGKFSVSTDEQHTELDSTNRKASDADVIKWQLRFITEAAGEGKLSSSEMNLVISFEEQFNKNGRLSEKQMEVLREIYERRTQ